MSQKIIDYTLNNLVLSNPDGSCPTTATGCAVAAGPGATPLGAFAQALDFNAGGLVKVSLPIASLNATKFCIRLVFKVDNALTGGQALTESNALPFSFSLIPGTGTSEFHLVAGVTTTAHG